MNLIDTVLAIEEWSAERGIPDHATPESQMLKTMEEVGELADAIGKQDLDEVMDAIGDIVVTLIIQCQLQGCYFDACVSGAYDVISKRKGKMVNGIFVKEESK